MLLILIHTKKTEIKNTLKLSLKNHQLTFKPELLGGKGPVGQLGVNVCWISCGATLLFMKKTHALCCSNYHFPITRNMFVMSEKAVLQFRHLS